MPKSPGMHLGAPLDSSVPVGCGHLVSSTLSVNKVARQAVLGGCMQPLGKSDTPPSMKYRVRAHHSFEL